MFAATFTGVMMQAEARLLILVMLFSLAGLMALGLLGQHVEGVMLTLWRDAIDPTIYRMPRWLLRYMQDLTALGGLPVTLSVAVLSAGLFHIQRRRADAALMLAGAAGGLLLGMGLKLVFLRPRPELVPHAVEVLTTSFPSSHATMSMVVYLGLGLAVAARMAESKARLYVLALGVGLPLAIGASRVVLGVHWPSDVLGGWAFGAGWVLLCRYIAFKRLSTH